MITTRPRHIVRQNQHQDVRFLGTRCRQNWTRMSCGTGGCWLEQADQVFPATEQLINILWVGVCFYLEELSFLPGRDVFRTFGKVTSCDCSLDRNCGSKSSGTSSLFNLLPADEEGGASGRPFTVNVVNFLHRLFSCSLPLTPTVRRLLDGYWDDGRRLDLFYR